MTWLCRWLFAWWTVTWWAAEDLAVEQDRRNNQANGAKRD